MASQSKFIIIIIIIKVNEMNYKVIKSFVSKLYKFIKLYSDKKKLKNFVHRII